MARKPANVTLPKMNQGQAAFLVGKSRRWVVDNIQKPKSGKYDPREVVEVFAGFLRTSRAVEIVNNSSDSDAITRRKKLAEAQNAEETLELNRLKIARIRGELMPVDRVHQIIDMAAAELRKPIEIIGRKHPELQQLIINGLDNARDKLALIFENDSSDV